MVMARKLFRQAALDRLSSPEQLDRAVTVSDPLGWLSLSTLLLLLSAILAWGVFGHIPDQVQGKGIFVATGGQVMGAMSPSTGIIANLSVSQNSIVRKGQEIAVIQQDALHQELLSARAMLEERTKQRQIIQRNNAEEIRLKTENAAKQRGALESIMKVATARAQSLAASRDGLEALAAQGFASRSQVEAKVAEYNAALLDVSVAHSRILEFDADLLALQTAHVRSMTDLDLRTAELQHRIRELDSRLLNDSRVLAPATGRIAEVKAFEGEVVQRGASVASVATEGDALQVILFVPTVDGKRIEPGMDVHIAPSTVKKEEFGALLGRVEAVGDFPATREGLLAILQNNQLAAAYSEEGAPYVARVNLTTDSKTPSGFKWTSGLGPPQRVTVGTVLEAEITLSEDRPINLILPFIRKKTGIGFWAEWFS